MKIDKKTMTYLMIAIGLIVIFLLAMINQCQTKTKKTTQPQPTSSQTVTISDLSDVLKTKVFFPFLDSNKNINYLGDKGIIFYRYNPTSQEKNKIWEDEVLGTYQAIYSPDGTKAIVKSNYPEMKNVYYDFQNKKTNELSNKIGNMVFIPTGQKIIYHYFNEEKNESQISMADPDGSNWQKITDLNELKIYDPYLIISPDGNKLALYPAPEGYGQNYIYLLDLQTKQISKITDDGYALAPIWSPNSQKIVYQVLDPKTFKPTLWIMNADGGNKKSLKIHAFSEKVIWQDEQNLLIALDPDLPDDFASDLTYKSQDVFWTYNIESSQINQFSTNKTYTEVEDLMYDSQNKTLYFTSNDVLYKLEIE